MTTKLVLAGADVVLPDRVQPGAMIVIEDGRITDILPRPIPTDSSVCRIDLAGHLIVPGFVDLHVHGLDGLDAQDGPGAVAEIAARMPRYGVTAFSPTTVACPPEELRAVLQAVRACREHPVDGRARVLPAHLESNFINPDYKGAQPAACLRLPSSAFGPRASAGPAGASAGASFTGADILAVIDEAGPDVGIVTVASELDGGLDLIRRLASGGRIVSLGHSAATYEQASEAIRAGGRHATHLFNRMPPVNHREPGLAGAILQAPEVAAEIVCDAYHVHPAMVRVALAAKGADRVMAITDGSAGAGLPPGSTARLGGRRLNVTAEAAFLDDHTLAGSTATMDRVFRVLTAVVGVGLVEAAILCATTPARELGLTGFGVIAPGAVADLAILDSRMSVVETCIAGRPCLGAF
jgi:N-acetylglucosamine-6-phosphate deacetylase